MSKEAATHDTMTCMSQILTSMSKDITDVDILTRMSVKLTSMSKGISNRRHTDLYVCKSGMYA